jgi:hypothetical protein
VVQIVSNALLRTIVAHFLALALVAVLGRVNCASSLAYDPCVGLNYVASTVASIAWTVFLPMLASTTHLWATTPWYVISRSQ